MSDPITKQYEADTMPELNYELDQLNQALRARLEEAERLLAETTDALFHAFRCADTEQMHEEVMKGRWDGVRAIVEKNERFLKEPK